MNEVIMVRRLRASRAPGVEMGRIEGEGKVEGRV
jgi:hypothetical protein